MRNETWAVHGVNYWENPSCPREYLEAAMISLLEYVEGVEVPPIEVAEMSEQTLRDKIGFYEYLAEK